MDFTHLKTNCLDLLAEGLFLKLFWMFDLSTLLPCHLLFSSPRAIRSVLLKFQFIFSTAIDGKIKAWLYDNLGSRVDYDAPGQWCTTMLYSADGSRYENFKIWTSTNWVFSIKKKSYYSFFCYYLAVLTNVWVLHHSWNVLSKLM